MKVVLDKGAYMPEYAHDTDAGMDLRSPRDVIIPCRQKGMLTTDNHYEEIITAGCASINTGVHVELPKNTVGFLKSKSGLNVNHGIVSEGVIDEGYTGPIVVKLYNHSDKDYTIHKGDKITQLVVLPYIHVDLEQVEKLEETERGEGGMGSTGV